MPVVTKLIVLTLLIGPGGLMAVEPVLGDAAFLPTPDQPIGYRGDGSGVFPGAKPISDFQPDGRGQRWKVELPGRSGASPIVVGRLVVVTSDPDLVLAFDADTGKAVWQADSAWTDGLAADEAAQAREALAAAKAKDKSLNRWGRVVPGDGLSLSLPTPASDGQRIYVKCALGTVCAYDLTGKRLWRHADANLNLAPVAGSSPLLADGKLIYIATSATKSDNRAIVATALEAATGRVAWQTGGLTRAGYRMSGSPCRVSLAGQEVIVLPTGDAVRATDGQRLTGQVTASVLGASPAVHDGVVYTTFQPSGDNGHTKSEYWLVAERLEVAGDRLTTTEVFRVGRSCFTLSPPLVHQGLVLIIGSKGLERYDARTGAALPSLGKLALPTDGHAFWPAPTAAGTSVVLVNLGGEVHVLSGGPGGTVVAGARLEAMNATPFFQGDRAYVRTGSALYCFGQ